MIEGYAYRTTYVFRVCMNVSASEREIEVYVRTYVRIEREMKFVCISYIRTYVHT